VSSSVGMVTENLRVMGIAVTSVLLLVLLTSVIVLVTVEVEVARIVVVGSAEDLLFCQYSGTK
jgi:hypothetical protein